MADPPKKFPLSFTYPDGTRKIIGEAYEGEKGEIRVLVTDPALAVLVENNPLHIDVKEPVRPCEWDDQGNYRPNYNICVAEGCFGEACLRQPGKANDGK